MSVGDATPRLPTLRAELAVYLHRAYSNAGTPLGLDAINRCLFVLDALALATSDYELLRTRLNNAQRYSRRAEWGAARFELRLLLHAMAEMK